MPRLSRVPGRSLLRNASARWLLLVAPAILFLGVFYVLPLLSIASRSVTEPESVGLGNYLRFFQTDSYRRVLFNTLRTAAVVTALTLVLGYPYAYVMRAQSRRVAALLLFAVLLPFWSSLLVRTYAWTVLLRDSGIINTVLINLGVIAEPIEMIRTPVAVQIGLSHVLLPFMVLPLYAVMLRIEPDFDLAARNLGASAFTSFRRVFLPMSLPGVLAGALLVFVLATGYYITPALLGGPRDQMLGELIVTQVSKQLDWGMGSTMAVLLALLTLAILGVAAAVIRLPDMFGSGAGE